MSAADAGVRSEVVIWTLSTVVLRNGASIWCLGNGVTGGGGFTFKRPGALTRMTWTAQALVSVVNPFGVTCSAFINGNTNPFRVMHLTRSLQLAPGWWTLADEAQVAFEVGDYLLMRMQIGSSAEPSTVNNYTVDLWGYYL